jgi:hypothetical protein
MEISVCIDYRVVANTGGVLRVLHCKLSDDGRVGRCSVARKVAHVGTDLGAQHFGNVKQKVDIAICRERARTHRQRHAQNHKRICASKQFYSHTLR